jgi:hypothetical protein
VQTSFTHDDGDGQFRGVHCGGGSQSLPVPTFGGAQVHALSMHEAGAGQFALVHW